MAMVAQSPIISFGADDMSFSQNQAIHAVEYIPNPHFSFPAQAPLDDSSITPARASSMRLSSSPSPHRIGPQRKSASGLPTFSFNASDTSGLTASNTNTLSAGQTYPTTPSRGGHRRGASEFVGGSARLGTSELISTSPVKGSNNHIFHDNVLANGSPARKKGHAHRRSGAVSVHDLSGVIQPRDSNTSSSSPATFTGTSRPVGPGGSLPQSVPLFTSTPPAQVPVFDEDNSRFQTLADRSVIRPRVVGFAENIEIIPRPLSIISSEVESNTSTPTNHSLANSFSSIFDFASGSPVVKRSKSSPLQQAPDNQAVSGARSSLELSRGLEREGHWLRTDTERPVSDSTANSPNRACKRSISFPIRNPLERRCSEPSLAQGLAPQSSASAISLQEPIQSHFVEHVDPVDPSSTFIRRSSAKKVKEWASHMMGRMDKPPGRARSADSARARAAQDLPGTPLIPSVTVSPSQEPDLEELFSHDPFSQPQPGDAQSPPQPRLDLSQISNFRPTFNDTDDDSPVIDLDAALDTITTPRDGKAIGLANRRQLHSSRGNREFAFHARTQSAPALAPFDYMNSGSPVQSPMADVFEEDEEEEEQAVGKRMAVRQSRAEDNKEGTRQNILRDGGQVEGAASEAGAPSVYSDTSDGLGIHRSANNDGLTGPNTCGDRRPSIIEDTIFEEASPVEIVQSDEEPRISVLTKSSDSSDTPTVLGDHSATILDLPPPSSSLMTPTTYAASTFSSPDFARRQGSFDTSRVGTSASSVTDCRTVSSAAHDMRLSMDDVPSLTSSHSTMVSTMPRGGFRRDLVNRTAPVMSDTNIAGQMERRRKRSSIQSLTKLVGSSFSDSKNKVSAEQRLSTSSTSTARDGTKKREHRLSRLMFWKHKTTARSPSLSQ